MEIERVRYSVVKYLRIRLQKIEEQLEMLMENPELLERLSVAEKVFATKLFSLHQDLFEESILKRLPETNAQYFRTIDDRYRHAQSNMEVRVSCCLLFFAALHVLYLLFHMSNDMQALAPVCSYFSCYRLYSLCCYFHLLCLHLFLSNICLVFFLTLYLFNCVEIRLLPDAGRRLLSRCLS